MSAANVQLVVILEKEGPLRGVERDFLSLGLDGVLLLRIGLRRDGLYLFFYTKKGLITKSVDFRSRFGTFTHCSRTGGCSRGSSTNKGLLCGVFQNNRCVLKPLITS